MDDPSGSAGARRSSADDSAAPAMAADAYDGVECATLRERLRAPRLALHATIPSTMDAAHALGAAGAPAGTLVLADAQSGGRGRAGRRWSSPPGGGIWMTLLERPRDASAFEVLSLRLGLHAAEALQRFAAAEIRVKWPNDLYVGAGKLAGILVEARWRDAQPDWVAIGFGLNVVQPADRPDAAGLAPGVARLDVLDALVPALRDAAGVPGPLTEPELSRWAARDFARGRVVRAPVAGVVQGIARDGALRVLDADGREHQLRQGSLEFEP